MPGPIEKIGVGAIAPKADVAAGKTAQPARSKFQLANEVKEIAAEKPGNLPGPKELERDLRKRIERVQSQEPAKVFGPDFKDLRTRLDATAKRVDGNGPIRDRLSEIEAQYTAAEDKLKNIPDTNNLRDLLAMQAEMYKLGHNIEILSKVVDSASQGIKQTLQTQV